MKKLRVLANYSYDKVGSYRFVNPFKIIFVYPAFSKPFVLKGDANIIDPILKINKEPMMVNHTFWHHGKHRGYWELRNVFEGVYLKALFIKDNIKQYGRPYVIVGPKGNVIKKLRRMPRKWMKELNPFVKRLEYDGAS